MSDIKQLDSKVVYQNKWMTVREDKIYVRAAQRHLWCGRQT